MAESTAVNRYAAVPLYRQIGEELERRLEHEFAPGDRLPSEAELAAEYGVNRLTVRRALTGLQQRGRIETRMGTGSFVAPPIVRYDVSTGREASFTLAMGESGHDVVARPLSVEDVDDAVLGRARRFRGLRIVDGVPWSLTVTVLAAGLAAGWDGKRSLHQMLRETHAVRIVRAHRTFAADVADRDDAALLRIPVGSPLLCVDGLNVDQGGNPVALVQHRFRGDRIQFTVDLR
ncbi:GntR family transcriptional regulator [Nocardia puris]|uniref:GntR family transcriptional regulator n=1 Tax=Nocardia puris TaxID=208602 RepID=UPI001892D51D|nr:GntR family transcriptional regulator [Nocardia puris]MBF6213127.1 GntR family transcriptional regulator [Nocardia puris]MBF6370056.1 GntR family transcriptional regulator [Nocardia puris]MBF6462752.1 GntR family transcriptional regulator [Nocardia puris]